MLIYETTCNAEQSEMTKVLKKRTYILLRAWSLIWNNKRVRAQRVPVGISSRSRSI